MLFRSEEEVSSEWPVSEVSLLQQKRPNSKSTLTIRMVSDRYGRDTVILPDSGHHDTISIPVPSLPPVQSAHPQLVHQQNSILETHIPLMNADSCGDIHQHSNGNVRSSLPIEVFNLRVE